MVCMNFYSKQTWHWATQCCLQWWCSRKCHNLKHGLHKSFRFASLLSLLKAENTPANNQTHLQRCVWQESKSWCFVPLARSLQISGMALFTLIFWLIANYFELIMLCFHYTYDQVKRINDLSLSKYRNLEESGGSQVEPNRHLSMAWGRYAVVDRRLLWKLHLDW